MPAGVVPLQDPLADIEAEFAGLIAKPWPAPDADGGSAPSGQPAGLLPRPAPPSRRRGVMLVDPAELDLMLADHAQAAHRFRALVDAASHGAALLDALDLPPLALDVLDVAIAALDFRDGDADLEDDDTAEAEPDDEDGGDREPSIGASNPTFGGSLGDTVSQIGWGCGADDMDREHDPANAEPYLSVVEFDGRCDNWWRSGQPTSAGQTDVEDCSDAGEEDFRAHSQDGNGWYEAHGLSIAALHPAVAHG